MPKATCPSCKTEVKYAKDTKKGTALTCPECDETFTPPELHKKTGYDPETDEDTYKVKNTKGRDATEQDKSRHAAEAAKGARKRERELDEMSRGPRKKKGWLEGPEIWFLVIGLIALIGLPLFLLVVRR